MRDHGGTLSGPVRAGLALLAGVTLVLMLWGAATRAARAGLACPDWPLCHGQVIPPTSTGDVPDGVHTAVQVWLEFVHRVLALVVVLGVASAWRPLGLAGFMRTRAWMAAVLAAQVGMGAATVWLGNAPWTVVLHLGLAMAFIALASRASWPARGVLPGALSAVLAGMVGVQMLVGAKVSSSLYGLACADFPTCQGAWWPEHVNVAVAWQLLHRALGTGVVVLATVTAFRFRARARPRALGVLALVQLLLGALNVWWGTPVWASTAHLGVAAVMWMLAVTMVGRSGGADGRVGS